MKSLYIEPQLGSRVLVLSVDLEAVEEEGGDEAFTENWQEKKGSLSDLHGHLKKTKQRWAVFLSLLSLYVQPCGHTQ